MAAVVVPAVLAACGDGPTEPRDGPLDVGMAVLTMTMAQAPATLDGEDTYQQACPSGGRFTVEGTSGYAVEGEVSVLTWDEVMRYEDCALSLESSEAVANGEMHLVGEARFGPPVDGVSPILMQESGQVGTMTTLYRGETRTCAYDLAHVYDPEADNYHITGTACGRSVDLRVPTHP